MAKPQPKRVPSDDCAVTVDGTVYFPHEGEWVEVIPGVSVGEVHAYRSLMDVGPALAAAAGEPDERATRTRLTDDAFEALLAGLCRRVVTWSWTDYLGNPMAQPQIGNPGPLRVLETEELLWLVNVVMGRTPAQEGKDSKPLPTTSSDSEPTRSPNGSSTVHSLELV